MQNKSRVRCANALISVKRPGAHNLVGFARIRWREPG